MQVILDNIDVVHLGVWTSYMIVYFYGIKSFLGFYDDYQVLNFEFVTPNVAPDDSC